MRLRVLLPTHVLLDRTVRKVSAEAPNGSFTLLPRHIDFATILVPGLLAFVSEEGEETFLAVDQGTLVKRGADVLASVHSAFECADLSALREVVAREFEDQDELERKARSALVRLETDIMRRFMELGERLR